MVVARILYSCGGYVPKAVVQFAGRPANQAELNKLPEIVDALI